MVRNRIKVLRAEADISAAALADKMPAGVDKIVMSYIEKGRVLPTRDGLDAMCDVLDCLPTDIYNAHDIDLLAVKHKPGQPAKETAEMVNVKAFSAGDKQMETVSVSPQKVIERHRGMEQLRVWMDAEEKAALFKAVECLGYHSVSEWLREMYRITIHKYISMNLKNRALHESILPTTQNQSI